MMTTKRSFLALGGKNVDRGTDEVFSAFRDPPFSSGRRSESTALARRAKKYLQSSAARGSSYE
jgi:hypothetical protein